MSELSASSISATPPASKWSMVRLLALGVVVLALLYAGLSWRMGWFPFAGIGNEASMLDAVTAPGPSTLSQEELNALLKQTSAQGTSKLTAEQQAALIRATSAE